MIALLNEELIQLNIMRFQLRLKMSLVRHYTIILW